ncbi:MAG: hypothetical protein K0S45_2578 [Nitrospira sp.]|nr:hypothetical protein [Nitrospira sp.]
MTWETPAFVKLKMDAEIGSYQDDFEQVPDVTQHREPVAAQGIECDALQAVDKLFHGHANSTR